MAQIIEMPKLSDTMTVGTLITWLKKEGDKVEPGEMLAEVETDKATMELENYEEGVLLKFYVQEGDQVPIGGAICAVGQEGEEAPEPLARPEAEGGDGSREDKKDKKEKIDEAPPAVDESGEASGRPADKESGDSGEGEAGGDRSKADSGEAVRSGDGPVELHHYDDGSRIKASPLARKIARDRGVDLRGVKGTGPHGRIVKADVVSAAESGATAPSSRPGKAAPAATAPAGGFIASGGAIAEEADLKVSNMRATIARRLVESKTEYPHFYLEIETDAAPLMKLRQDLNASLSELPPERGGVKFTVNDFILKATVEALRRVPSVNRSWNGDTIRQHGAVHLAFGVAVDEGLLTPVIRNASAKGLRQISAEARELIEKARTKKLKPEEMTQSTFTVTNLGMFGIRNFYGIINPPNAGILSVGATIERPVVVDGVITVGQRMNIGFSGDHRVVDGATGATFMQALKEILETPALMLV